MSHDRAPPPESAHASATPATDGVLGTGRPPLDAERLAGLVFELASQLQAERLHRIALEHALERAGVLPAAALAAAAADPAVRERGRRELDASVARLLRVITENADRRSPLRDRDGGP